MKKNNEKVFNCNTHLCVNVKTMLRGERQMKAGKDYQGVLRRDVEVDDLRYDERFTFIETLPWTMKRNPRLYRGKYITLTRRDDGSLRLNFRPLPAMGKGFSLERYAFGVYIELHKALEGLVEEE